MNDKKKDVICIPLQRARSDSVLSSRSFGFPAARLFCSRLNLKQNRSVTHFPREPDKTEHEILIASLCDDGTKPKTKKSLDPNKSTIVKTGCLDLQFSPLISCYVYSHSILSSPMVKK